MLRPIDFYGQIALFPLLRKVSALLHLLPLLLLLRASLAFKPVPQQHAPPQNPLPGWLALLLPPQGTTQGLPQ
jgi:hypothetical protein